MTRLAWNERWNEQMRNGKVWNDKELWNLAAVGWAAMLGGGALILEHGFGMAPCALCLNQRLWALLAGLLALGGLAHNPRIGIYPLLAILASVAGAGFSLRHLYLLTLPADEVAGCGVGLEYMIDVFPLLDILRHMTVGTGECTEQGFAIPLLALFGFIGMATLCAAYWRKN